MARIQFILKYRDMAYTCDDNSDYSYGYLSSGLFNSARFVQEMLRDELGYETQIDHAIDNNSIDRLVTEFKPDICIIEAYWVVPEKFDILAKLHPKITWVIRNHSATPFAANEGIIMDWSLRYMDHPNVIVACNDFRTDKEFLDLVEMYKPDWSRKQCEDRCTYLPNYYPISFKSRKHRYKDDVIDIGCFGAIRPLKNHLMQAVAAVEFAQSVGKKLRFHINSSRIEGRGEPILHNVEKMFRLLPDAELVEHPWMPHDKFVELLRTMDLGLQVSYSETFNIVTADMVVNDVPVVTSPEVKWVHALFHSDPNDSKSIIAAMHRAIWADKYIPFWHPNLSRLKDYDHKSKHIWNRFIQRITCK